MLPSTRFLVSHKHAFPPIPYENYKIETKDLHLRLDELQPLIHRALRLAHILLHEHRSDQFVHLTRIGQALELLSSRNISACTRPAAGIESKSAPL